jgi:hypothetical protein
MNATAIDTQNASELNIITSDVAPVETSVQLEAVRFTELQAIGGGSVVVW